MLRAANEREESPNGYQVIQQITERSGGVWKPSPGSVYPTVQQACSTRSSSRTTRAGAAACD
ncbi:helix-turn-helix transcriptional regulator [Nocardioides convexus]|uniref:PadR family transcriptional regulator n=1 Tax=Nocardioides convexus TaxID=2712224 RepID=UPI0024188E5C|nr:helix-turn-helix transcriptional regulator [Nocardioides convexus]